MLYFRHKEICADIFFFFWQHEAVSRKMLVHMIEKNESLKKEFKKTFTKKDLKMIGDLIDGEVICI